MPSIYCGVQRCSACAKVALCFCLSALLSVANSYTPDANVEAELAVGETELNALPLEPSWRTRMVRSVKKHEDALLTVLLALVLLGAVKFVTHTARKASEENEWSEKALEKLEKTKEKLEKTLEKLEKTKEENAKLQREVQKTETEFRQALRNRAVSIRDSIKKIKEEFAEHRRTVKGKIEEKFRVFNLLQVEDVLPALNSLGINYEAHKKAFSSIVEEKRHLDECNESFRKEEALFGINKDRRLLDELLTKTEEFQLTLQNVFEHTAELDWIAGSMAYSSGMLKQKRLIDLQKIFFIDARTLEIQKKLGTKLIELAESRIESLNRIISNL